MWRCEAERFQTLPVLWNPLIDVANMTYSGVDNNTVTKTGGGIGWNASGVSQNPTTRFTVRFNRNGASNDVVIGFIAISDFTPTSDNCSKPNSFCLYTYNGTLHGNGNSYKAYGGDIADGSIIEYVRDLQRATISFIVNGVDKGVAFTAVPREDLFAIANIHYQNISVTFVK